MPALNLRDVFAAKNDGSVLGDILVGEVNHHVVFLKVVLKGANVNACRRSLFLYGETSRVRRRLTREYSGGNNAEHIPRVTCSVSASSRGKHIGVVAACKRAERHLPKVVSVLKVVYRADRVVKMLVCIGDF